MIKLIKRIPFYFLLFFILSGINKIQYKNFDFKELETEHFRIFYYSGGEKLARFASHVLEEAYPEMREFFKVKIDFKIPVLIYNSPNDFRQTNVVLENLPEGVGGFTEIFKKRVVVPFNGSYEEFRHVLVHELTHVFEYQLYFGNIGQYLISGNAPDIPLFVMEGLAEYLSHDEDAETRGFARDLIINNILPHLQEFTYMGGYIVYRLGELFFRFIEDKYGREKVSEFVRGFVAAKNLRVNVKKVFGIDIYRFSDYFNWYLKEKLYTNFTEFKFPLEKADQITFHRREGGFLNIGVALSPDGSRVAFLSDRTGFTDIFMVEISTKKVKKIISGQKNPSLENLHLVRPGISFSRDGRFLTFITSGGKSDFIFIYDVEKGRIIKKYELKNLDAGYEPSFSPDGSNIVFSGIKDGFSDIYIFDISSEEIKTLTEDKYDDRNPVFIDDTTILFVSDRNNENYYGSYAVFSLNPENGIVKRLTPYIGSIEDPYLYENKIFFLYDDPQGLRNLCYYDLEKDSLYRLTDFPTYIHDVSYSDNLNSVAVSLLWKGGYDIFTIYEILSYFKPKKIELKEIKGNKWKEGDYLSKDYTFSLTPDWVIAGVGYYPLYGYYGGVTMGFSDIPGNWRITFFSELSDNLLDSNWDLFIMYLKKRTDYYFEFYQYFPYYILSETQDALDRDLGVFFGFSHPIDIFNRIETGFNFSYRERYLIDYFYQRITFSTFLVFDYAFYYIFDRSFRFYNGTKDGEILGIGFKRGLSPEYSYVEVLSDFRKYFRLTPRSNLAFRIYYGFIDGDEKVISYFFGSPYMMRGYDLFTEWGRELLYGTVELRIPFLDRLKLGFLPLEIGGIKGVLFIEAGLIGDKSEFKKFKLFEKSDGFYKTKDLLMDIGFGFRFNMGYFYLKLDFAKKWDLQKTYGSWKWWVTFGDDF